MTLILGKLRRLVRITALVLLAAFSEGSGQNFTTILDQEDFQRFLGCRNYCLSTLNYCLSTLNYCLSTLNYCLCGFGVFSNDRQASRTLFEASKSLLRDFPAQQRQELRHQCQILRRLALQF